MPRRKRQREEIKRDRVPRSEDSGKREFRRDLKEGKERGAEGQIWQDVRSRKRDSGKETDMKIE